MGIVSLSSTWGKDAASEVEYLEWLVCKNS